MNVTHTVLLEGNRKDLLIVNTKLSQIGSCWNCDRNKIRLNGQESVEIITHVGLQQMQAMLRIYRDQADFCLICIDPNNEESLRDIRTFKMALKQANEARPDSKIFLACSADFLSMETEVYMQGISNELNVKLLKYSDISNSNLFISTLFGINSLERAFKSALEAYKMSDESSSMFKSCKQKLRNLCDIKNESDLEFGKPIRAHVSESEYRHFLLSVVCGDQRSNKDLKKHLSGHSEQKIKLN